MEQFGTMALFAGVAGRAQVGVARATAMAYMPQAVALDRDTALLPYVLEARADVPEIEREMRRLEDEIHARPADEALLRRLGELQERFNTRGPYKGNFPAFKAIGIPLILVKRTHAMGPLRTSDAPVSLGDIPQTVADELGLDAEFPGKSMFRVQENEDRERIYRAFVGPQEDVEYLAPLYEYAVRGFSWDDTSWRETGKVYYPPKN